MNTNAVSAIIIHEALETHRELGPGLLESVYESVLAKKLTARGLTVQRQRPVPFIREGILYPESFRLDLLVEDTVVVEVKSVETDHPVFSKQLLTYLKILDLQVGLLINFGKPLLRDGLKRVVNGLQDENQNSEG